MRDSQAGGTACFLIDRSLPGITLGQLAALRQAVHVACRRLSADGQSIRYLGSTFLPAQSRCLCLFEAADKGVVVMANETAQAPFSRVDEALGFSAPA